MYINAVLFIPVTDPCPLSYLIIDSCILVVTESIEIRASLLQLETFSLRIIDTASYAGHSLSSVTIMA